MIPAEGEALSSLKSPLASLDPRTVRYPDMPSAAFVVEMNALTETWLRHSAQYAARGIDAFVSAKQLKTGVLAFSAAEHLWQKAAAKSSDGQNIWRDQHEPAQELLAEAVSCLDYILPENSDARRELESITEGTGNADMIMDLGRTAALCREFAAPLAKAAFTDTMINQLQDYYVTLTDAYGSFCSDKKDVSPELDMRNRVFTYCKAIEAEMKRAAKMVFRREPEVLKMYRSDYKHAEYLRGAARKEAKALANNETELSN